MNQAQLQDMSAMRKNDGKNPGRMNDRIDVTVNQERRQFS
jgi:hypothetical protein